MRIFCKMCKDVLHWECWIPPVHCNFWCHGLLWNTWSMTKQVMWSDAFISRIHFCASFMKNILVWCFLAAAMNQSRCDEIESVGVSWCKTCPQQVFKLCLNWSISTWHWLLSFQVPMRSWHERHGTQQKTGSRIWNQCELFLAHSQSKDNKGKIESSEGFKFWCEKWFEKCDFSVQIAIANC